MKQVRLCTWTESWRGRGESGGAPLSNICSVSWAESPMVCGAGKQESKGEVQKVLGSDTWPLALGDCMTSLCSNSSL